MIKQLAYLIKFYVLLLRYSSDFPFWLILE